MKVEVKEKPVKHFAPFQLVIDVDSPEELNNLYARMNIAPARITDAGSEYKKSLPIERLSPLFSILYEKCESYFEDRC